MFKDSLPNSDLTATLDALFPMPKINLEKRVHLPSTVDEQFQTQFQKQTSDEQKTKLLKPESDIAARELDFQKAYNEALKDGSVPVNLGMLKVIGQEGVGKTCLINACLGKEFEEKHVVTDGIAVIRTASTTWTEAKADSGNTIQQYTKMVTDKLRKKKTVNIDMKPPIDDDDGIVVDYNNHGNNDGTDTATQAVPFDTDQQLDKDVIKKVEENKEETLEETFNIWDHGGQLIYHGLHRMFMTLQALYIVVFDLSKPLDDLATFIDSSGRKFQHHWTNLQFILSYMLSVYSHSRIVEEDEENEVDKPTILIVGTHKGKLGKTEKQQNDEAEKVFKIIQDVLKTKPYGNHVYHKYFAIENSQPTTDKSFSDLKQVIDTLMKALEQPFPLKWMRFRCDLHDLRGKKQPSFSLCPLKEIKILTSKNGIVEEKNKSVLLNFLYDLGEIVYMPDNKLLRDKVVLDPMRLVEIVTKFVTVVPPKYPAAKFRESFDKLDKGILEEDLLRKLWKDSKVDNGKNFEFLVALMIQLGFICERKTTISQDVASTSTKSVGKRSFFVPLRLAIKTSKVRQLPDDSQSISRPIYYDFEGYLPDVLFPYLIIEFLNKFQKEGVNPILACNYAELYLDENHHVTLSLDKFITKNDERKFLLKMAIKRTDSFDETSNEEPSAEACKLVLSTVEKSFKQSKDGGRRGIPFKRCIPCRCSDQLDKKHFQILKDFQCRKFTCTETGKSVTMDVTCYKRLFGDETERKRRNSDEDEIGPMMRRRKIRYQGSDDEDQNEGASSSHQSQPREDEIGRTKRKRRKPGQGSSDKDQNEGTSSSHQSTQREDFSEDDFRQLITDFAQWFDERGLLNRLQVLFIEIVGDVEAVKKVTSTIKLLALLTANGKLSQTNLSVLYDAIKVTEQFGFESTITEKLPAFKDIKEHEVVSFPAHTLTIFKLGKSLSDSDKETLDGRYNFPVLKGYTDSWSLILDFVPRGLLSEDKIKSVKKMLKDEKKWR
ncbi:uncharacterized protein [Antedon mediterranea]|uniref:uncharacterized protein n=1 Tax=Antedon mediterranea TaxID=105859 RepID=UPI003AF69C1E